VKRVQLAVIGGGLAGRLAAGRAVEHGVQTIRIDESWLHGGAIEDLEPDHAGFDYGRPHVVWGLFEDNVLGITSGSKSYELQAEQVILATGSTDLPCPFPGGSLPGVLSGRALFFLTFKMQVMPGRRFVVIGAGQDAAHAIWTIDHFGGEVVAQVLSHQLPTFRATGERGVETVEIDGERVNTDVVVVAIGRQPDIELALMAGCDIGFSEELGGFVPVLDEHLRTSHPAILAAGDAAGICSQEIAVQEGKFAGLCAAHALGLVDESEFAREQDWYVSKYGDRVNQHKAVAPSYVQV
jgi:pyruvate/2-oxoglutarate dehydrogenase complex dihydrolipoamide dehydrogenase (E3) component